MLSVSMTCDFMCNHVLHKHDKYTGSSVKWQKFKTANVKYKNVDKCDLSLQVSWPFIHDVHPSCIKVIGNTCCKLIIKSGPPIYYQILGLPIAVCQCNESHRSLSVLGAYMKEFGRLALFTLLIWLIFPYNKIDIKCQFNCTFSKTK